MSSQPLNPPELYRFAWGYFAKRLRDDADRTMLEAGSQLGLSQTGYNYIEKGNSTNSDKWMELFELYKKDFVTVNNHCRVIVRAIQAEETSKGRELTRKECIQVANRLYVDLPF